MPGGPPPGMGPRPRGERARAYSHGMRHNYLMTLAATVVPGLGLLRTRARAFGVLLLGAAILLAVIAAVTVAKNGLVGSALSVGLSRSTLLTLVVTVLSFATLWCLSILLTSALTRPAGISRDDRLASILVGLLCCLLVIAPSAYAVRYLTIQRSVVAEVFAPSQSGTGTADPTVRVPVVGADDPWKAVKRVNVLLVGSDAGADRVGVRPDSLMVASIRPATGDVSLIGVPRNLENAPIPATNPLSALYPDGWNCGDQCLINGVWTLATDHPDLFPKDPSPGLRTTRDVVGAVLGIPIDYSIVIDLSGFKALVDAMGGVDINVKERVCIGCKVNSAGQIVGTTGYIEVGPQHLDGYHALWYARSRALGDDFSRMRRQRCVVGALVSQVSPASMLLRYPALADVLKQDVHIDIPQNQLRAWVPLIEKIQKRGTIRSLALTNKVIDVTRPDYAKIRALVANATSDHPATSSTSTSTSPSTTPSGSSSGTSSEPPAPNDELTDLKTAC